MIRFVAAIPADCRDPTNGVAALGHQESAVSAPLLATRKCFAARGLEAWFTRGSQG